MNENADLTDNELASFEKQVLSELQPDSEDPILDQQAPEGEQPPASAQTTPAPATAATTPPATPAEPEPTQGDPRAALRASRRAERQARDLAEQRNRENEQLKAELAQMRGTAAADPDADPDMAALEVDVPQAAAVVKKLLKKVDDLEQQLAAPKTASEPDFVPETLPPELQETVDDIPQLLAWQNGAQFKDHWTLAKSTDLMLTKHPAWKDKPEADRLNEVARRVSSEMGTPSTANTTAAAAKLALQRIQSAQEPGLGTLSDLRGGVAPNASPGTDFYSMKSDDEVMSALARLG